MNIQREGFIQQILQLISVRVSQSQFKQWKISDKKKNQNDWTQDKRSMQGLG
jgi:hypothetical protein